MWLQKYSGISETLGLGSARALQERPVGQIALEGWRIRAAECFGLDFAVRVWVKTRIHDAEIHNLESDILNYMIMPAHHKSR